MTNAFCDRVIREKVVDTKKYRYKFVEGSAYLNEGFIKRVPLEKLEAATESDWKTVDHFSLRGDEYTDEFVKWVFGGVC